MILPEQYEEGRGPYAEIASLKEENKKLRVALEEIAETIGYVEIRAIARKALAKEGK